MVYLQRLTELYFQVGLAVGDIMEVKEHATLERLKMQVDLALEVEFR